MAHIDVNNSARVTKTVLCNPAHLSSVSEKYSHDVNAYISRLKTTSTPREAHATLFDLPKVLIMPWLEVSPPRTRRFQPYWDSELQHLRQARRRAYQQSISHRCAAARNAAYEIYRGLQRRINSKVRANKGRLQQRSKQALIEHPQSELAQAIKAQRRKRQRRKTVLASIGPILQLASFTRYMSSDPMVSPPAVRKFYVPPSFRSAVIRAICCATSGKASDLTRHMPKCSRYAPVFLLTYSAKFGRPVADLESSQRIGKKDSWYQFIRTAHTLNPQTIAHCACFHTSARLLNELLHMISKPVSHRTACNLDSANVSVHRWQLLWRAHPPLQYSCALIPYNMEALAAINNLDRFFFKAVISQTTQRMPPSRLKKLCALFCIESPALRHLDVQEQFLRSLRELQGLEEPHTTWLAHKTLDSLRCLPQIRTVMTSPRRKSVRVAAHRAEWRNSLSGLHSAQIYRLNRFPPAFMLKHHCDRKLAIRWHLSTFPIPPACHQKQNQIRHYSQILQKLALRSPSTEELDDIQGAIRKIRDICTSEDVLTQTQLSRGSSTETNTQ